MHRTLNVPHRIHTLLHNLLQQSGALELRSLYWRKNGCIILLVYFRLGSETERPKVMNKTESSEEEEEEEEELTEEEKGEVTVNCGLCN